MEVLLSQKLKYGVVETGTTTTSAAYGGVWRWLSLIGKFVCLLLAV